MANKTTILRAFNTHFFEFIDFMLTIVKDDLNILTAKNAFEVIKKTNPTFIIKIWNSFIYNKYQYSIDSGDISFFFEKDYAKDLGKLSNQSEILEIINNLREPIRNMSDQNKAFSMKYIQTLSKLSDLYSKM
jgi:hypothetical protein